MENPRDMVDELRQENQDGTLVNLKILVTSPKASRSVNEWSNPDFHIMPTKTGGNGQTFDIMHTITRTDGPPQSFTGWSRLLGCGCPQRLLHQHVLGRVISYSPARSCYIDAVFVLRGRLE